jgi:hypothetical protein
MLIPLGILAASGAGVASDYELITTVVVSGSSTSSITFSNLGTYSSTYKHLQIRGLARMSSSGAVRTGLIRFNNDSAGNYSRHELTGGNGSVVSGAGINTSSPFFGWFTANTAPASSFGATVCDILDPYSTTTQTTVRSLSGWNTFVSLLSSRWGNTASVTSITISDGGNNFIAGSRFSLYGIKG